MTDKMNSDDFRKGISFEELLRSSTTSIPPTPFLRPRVNQVPETNEAGHVSLCEDKTSHPTTFRFGDQREERNTFTFTTTTLPTSYTDGVYSSHSFLGAGSEEQEGRSQDIDSPTFEFGHQKNTPSPFNFRPPTSMVREQVPARNPLMPSQGRTTMPYSGDEKAPIDLTSSPIARKDGTSAPFSPQPEFGRPTALNNNASPLAKPFVARTSSGQPPIRRSGDGTSQLFAKKRPGDMPLGYYKPPTGQGNPLANVGGSAPAQNQSRQQPQASADTGAYGLAYGGQSMTVPYPHQRQQATAAPTNPFVMPGPTQPLPQFKPVASPTFSSGSSTNPYLQPARIYDPVSKPNEDEGFNDAQVFGNDRFGTADPMMYMDSRQADEDIKALLEGAIEDDDDKPRTRRKKKEMQNRVDALTKKMQNIEVKSEGENQPEDDEEEEEEDDGTREGLKVKLLPHQIDGVSWMQDKELGTKKVKGVLPKGGILADDMGLGKTIQSIALMLANPRPASEQLVKLKRKIDLNSDPATLVVAPLALIKQWEGEIKDRIDEKHALKVKVHHGPQRTKFFKDLRKYDVVITTYQTLSSEHNDGNSKEKSALFGVHWYRVILDEAHSIKNRNAKTTKAAYDLTAEYRWCLTGTPMQNNLDELQSLIRFLRIKPYDQLEIWREQITKPMNNGRGGLAIRRLRAFLSAFMKRRTKDVLKQDGALKKGPNGEAKSTNPGFKIVKRTVEKVEVDFNPHERAFYQRLETRTDKSLERMMMGGGQSYASVLVLLMRLRQACNHPQLLGGDLSKEQDAFAESQASPRKGSKTADIDDIANMLGGLSVEAKVCDVCQIELNKDAAQQGQSTCEECLDDQAIWKAAVQEEKQKKNKTTKQVVRKERKVNRRVITDSDDEDDEQSQEISHESETEEETLEETSSEDDSDASDEYEILEKLPPVSSTKIRHLLKILKHDSHTHKYIVFSFFTSMLDLIEPFLKRHNLKFVRYDGAMRNDAREASLASLRDNSSVRILLCSLRAGSLGLNLTAASRVVVLEPFWNPFVEEQAIDRVHRLNQTQDVIVHKLTIKDTVEERILELQEKKRELAKATIEGQKGMGAGKLTLQEMLKLFKHDSEKDAKLDMIGMKDGRSLLDRDSQRVDVQRAALEATRHHTEGYQKRPEHAVYGRRWHKD